MKYRLYQHSHLSGYHTLDVLVPENEKADKFFKATIRDQIGELVREFQVPMYKSRPWSEGIDSEDWSNFVKKRDEVLQELDLVLK